jgi:membrane protein
MLQRLNSYIWSYNACNTGQARSSWRHFLQIIFMVIRDLAEGMITLRAMSLVYTTLLSIVPLLAVGISVLKGFGVHDQLEPTLIRLLAPLGENSAEISGRIVGFVENMKIGVLGTLGLVMLIYTAISLIQKIESAFNHTWRLQSSRSLLQRFSDYLSVILVGPVLVFSAVGITASLSSNHVVDVLNTLPYMNDLIHWVGKILPYFLIIAAFTFVYMLVPNTRVRLRSAFYGALFAGALWETSGVLFASFVGGSTSYTAIYSGFAILMVFMIWLYLNWVILLIGASISFYHQNPERLNWKKKNVHLSVRMRYQLALQAMVSIARAHDQNFELVTTAENLAGYQQVPVDVLQRMLDALEDGDLIRKSANVPAQYLPGTSIQRIRMVDIFKCARDAEDDGQTAQFHSDIQVLELLENLQQVVESHLGETTLAEFLQNFETESSYENNLV